MDRPSPQAMGPIKSDEPHVFAPKTRDRSMKGVCARCGATKQNGAGHWRTV